MKRSDRQEIIACSGLGIQSAKEVSARPIEPVNTTKKNRRKARPLTRRLRQLARRAHLYFGLFLLPWALLYGTTGFLFNHPGAFPDTTIVDFDQQDLVGTKLENPPPLGAFVDSLVDLLNSKNKTRTKWTVGDAPIRYLGRDTLVATVKSKDRSLSFVLNSKTQRGFIRENTANPSSNGVAPFATSNLDKPDKSNSPSDKAPPGKLVDFDNLESIVERIHCADPLVLQRKGFPDGVATVTRVPEIMIADTEWTASYHPLSKEVSGVKAKPAV